MISKKFVLKNSQGLHMRPAGVLAAEMGKFPCDVWILYEGKRINAKSIMNLMASGIGCGAEVEVCCNGRKEDAAMECATALIESGLGE